MSQADPARRCAWRVLEALEAQRVERIDQGLQRFTGGLSGRDAALARELCLGSLRHGLLYDALFARLLSRPDPPPALRRALRLAAHQCLGMDRIPAHAIGASTGSLLRWAGSTRLVAVANAVLRKLMDAIEGYSPSPRQEQHLPPAHPLRRIPPALQPRSLALRYGLPPLFLKHLETAQCCPDEEHLAYCTHCPPLATRMLPGLAAPEHPLILRQEQEWLWWKDASAAIAGPVVAGQALIQDPAQAAGLQLAGKVQGLRVLDCCAAPGGKALALAEAGAQVYAADRSLTRLSRLRSHPLYARYQKDIILLVADARRLCLEPLFDLVLLDVPCSNSAVWGRRPEALWRYDPRHLQSLCSLQASILRAASALVAQGGRLLYSTCSLCPQENQQQTAQLSAWSKVAESTTWPNAWQGGGYACLLQRQ